MLVTLPNYPSHFRANNTKNPQDIMRQFALSLMYLNFLCSTYKTHTIELDIRTM